MKTPTVAGTDEGRTERATTGETGTETDREGTDTRNSADSWLTHTCSDK